MEKIYNLNQIFEETDCPEQEVLELYLVGKLSPEKTHEVEHHLTDCGFCSDTLESMKMMGVSSFNAAVNRVNQTTERKAGTATEPKPAEKDTKVIPMRSRSYRWMGIAASVAVLAVATVFFMGGGEGDMDNLVPYAYNVAWNDQSRDLDVSQSEVLAEKGDFHGAAVAAEDAAHKGIYFAKAHEADSAIFYLKDLQESAAPDAAYFNWFYGAAQAQKGNLAEARAAITKAVNTPGFTEKKLGKKLLKAIEEKMEPGKK